jgi:hypothetical protein
MVPTAESEKLAPASSGREATVSPPQPDQPLAASNSAATPVHQPCSPETLIADGSYHHGSYSARAWTRLLTPDELDQCFALERALGWAEYLVERAIGAP